MRKAIAIAFVGSGAAWATKATFGGC